MKTKKKFDLVATAKGMVLEGKAADFNDAVRQLARRGGRRRRKAGNSPRPSPRQISPPDDKAYWWKRGPDWDL